MKENNISQTGAPARVSLQCQANTPQRILGVEDDREQRQINAMVLVFTGYTVDVAEDGAAAWEAVQASRFDLLITDNYMPRLTGLELLKEARSAGMKLPVAENEVKELAVNDRRQTLRENRVEPIIKSNGHQATNGH